MAASCLCRWLTRRSLGDRKVGEAVAIHCLPVVMSAERRMHLHWGRSADGGMANEPDTDRSFRGLTFEVRGGLRLGARRPLD
jgi:hypothetical protein